MRPNGSAGFTLLEMLVSLLAGALLLAGLTWMLGEVRSQWQRSGRAIAKVRQLDAATNVVRAMLEATVVAEPRTDETTFAGSADGLTALVPAPQAARGLGLVELHLARIRQANGVAFVASINPLSDRAHLPPALLAKQELGTSFSDVTFHYIERRADHVVTKTSWPASGRPPDAIRIDLIEHSSQTHALIIRSLGNTDGRCLLDPVSLVCRL